MESVIVKKNRFSLKNKAGASKFCSTSRQCDSNDGATIFGEQIIEKQLNPTNKNNIFYEWKSLPTIEDVMKVTAVTDSDRDININSSNAKSNPNSWTPLPKPCLKCIAQHFLRDKLLGVEDVVTDEKDTEVIKPLQGFVDDPQLTSKLQGHQNKNKNSPDYLMELKRLNEDISTKAMPNKFSTNIEPECCPLCLKELHTSNQVEKDAHIASCLSSDDMW